MHTVPAQYVQAVFGYGSLVNRKSAIKTLGRDPGQLLPVELTGWVRDWSVTLNNLAAERRFEMLPDRSSPEWVLALNVRKRSDNATNPNGYVYGVSEAELTMMDAREAHYERVDITADVTGEHPYQRVFTYVGKSDHLQKKVGAILPKSYITLVETGFRDNGGMAALETYRQTTISPGIAPSDTIHTSDLD